MSQGQNLCFAMIMHKVAKAKSPSFAASVLCLALAPSARGFGLPGPIQQRCPLPGDRKQNMLPSGCTSFGVSVLRKKTKKNSSGHSRNVHVLTELSPWLCGWRHVNIIQIHENYPKHRQYKCEPWRQNYGSQPLALPIFSLRVISPHCLWGHQ